MLDFFTRFFKPERSGATAKERLRLVLLSDHLSLAPDVVESLKRDLIEVISRYCEVDVANTDVSFEQQDSAVAMLANIPILGLRNGRPSAPASTPPAPPVPPSGATPAHAAVAHDGQTAADTLLVTPLAEPDVHAAAHALEATVASPVEPAKPKASRKRRRRRPNLTQQAPAT